MILPKILLGVRSNHGAQTAEELRAHTLSRTLPLCTLKLTSAMDTLTAFFEAEFSDYFTDKLPDFTAIGASPMLSAADVQSLCQTSDPKIAAAEAQCRAGESMQASASVD